MHSRRPNPFLEVDCPRFSLLRTTAGDPLLVKGAYGKGRVFAFLATPLGDEARDGKVFWKNPGYLELVRGKLK